MKEREATKIVSTSTRVRYCINPFIEPFVEQFTGFLMHKANSANEAQHRSCMISRCCEGGTLL